MSEQHVKALLARHRETVESALLDLLPPCPESARVIDEAMRYSLLGGGKRLRPALVLTTADALGGETGNVLPAACAIEMIHTYSLIHDDLPCMDDDDLRRGRPTCHVKYGDGLATLAGDALSNAAFHVIAEHTKDADLVRGLILELARAAGCEGMIGGQVLDVISEGEEPRLERVEEIHRMKTGALFIAGLRLGAVGSRASAETLERFTLYGRKVGLAFQIMDDILDLVSDAETLGKTAGKDLEQKKMTWPACVGLEESRVRVRGLVREAQELIAPQDPRGDLQALAAFIHDRVN